MIGIGILGCGRIGQVHARTLAGLPDACVTAVSDALPEAAASLAETTGAAIRDPQDLIEASDVDAVIIGTPTSTHAELIEAAARAGKAIFCEKPVDLSADRIRDLIGVVSDAGVPFMTAFNRRFDPSFVELKRRLADGALGQVEIVTILSRDPTPPPIGYVRTSGGLFRDMMIHDLDMARFLLGEEPVQIHAVGSSLVDAEIGAAGDVDTAAVTMTTASGKICQISNSRRATYGYDQRIEVHGEKGMLRAANQLEHSVEQAGPQGFATAPAQHFFLQRYAAAYSAEMRHFVDALKSGKAPQPGIEDGLKAQILADAATESWQSGNVVKL
ncbi:inositol 2-dehydrogenase [Paracoccus sp. Z330]|uniref:Inositol 2-dehydrogenase n=1 Tax=Paracoccus onchidii TaxID=3017813 RepID=A0ABT4ZGB3_9RHOB|nr:inositol 2-dehydrogenase [Paracoccus onchidii]MDB6178309.1 inositol 2-dehydrogenase [Paracoccus onchidii]